MPPKPFILFWLENLPAQQLAGETPIMTFTISSTCNLREKINIFYPYTHIEEGVWPQQNDICTWFPSIFHIATLFISIIFHLYKLYILSKYIFHFHTSSNCRQYLGTLARNFCSPSMLVIIMMMMIMRLLMTILS